MTDPSTPDRRLAPMVSGTLPPLVSGRVRALAQQSFDHASLGAAGAFSAPSLLSWSRSRAPKAGHMSSQTFRSSVLLAALLLAAAVRPDSVGAQHVTTVARDSAMPSAVTSPSIQVTIDSATAPGPRVAPAGIQRRANSVDAGQSRGEGAHMGAGTNVALIGVGAAALVLGLVIGGDAGAAVAIGGGVLGLVGLYRYIR
jgi:hypothetical protein